MLHGDQEDGVDITANSLHPGAIATNIHRYNSVLTGNCRIVLFGVNEVYFHQYYC